jgi:hypothetical protein
MVEKQRRDHEAAEKKLLNEAPQLHAITTAPSITTKDGKALVDFRVRNVGPGPAFILKAGVQAFIANGSYAARPDDPRKQEIPVQEQKDVVITVDETYTPVTIGAPPTGGPANREQTLYIRARITYKGRTEDQFELVYEYTKGVRDTIRQMDGETRGGQKSFTRIKSGE